MHHDRNTVRFSSHISDHIKIFGHSPLRGPNVDEFGERFPLTIFDYDRNLETIDIIYQKVGTSTMKLDKLNEQDYILDIVGPLGKASELENYNKTIVVSGGVGG